MACVSMLCAVHDAACCMHQPAHMRAFRLRTISAIVPLMQTHRLTHRCAPKYCLFTALCACAHVSAHNQCHRAAHANASPVTSPCADILPRYCAVRRHTAASLRDVPVRMLAAHGERHRAAQCKRIACHVTACRAAIAPCRARPSAPPGYSFIMNTCSIMFLSTPARSMSLARTGSPSAASCTAAFISDASRALMSFKSLSRDISACAPSCDIS